MKRLIIALAAVGSLAGFTGVAEASIAGNLQATIARDEGVARSAVAVGNGYTTGSGSYLASICAKHIPSITQSYSYNTEFDISGSYWNRGNNFNITNRSVAPYVRCNPSYWSGIFPLG